MYKVWTEVLIDRLTNITGKNIKIALLEMTKGPSIPTSCSHREQPDVMGKPISRAEVQ